MATRLPNILTYARILAVPVVVGCLLVGGDAWRWTALAIFIAAGVTDFFDGYLARLWGQQSSLGRMLDPIADKLLVAAVLLMLAGDNTIVGTHLWAAIIILCREILVSGLREFLAELRVPGRPGAPLPEVLQVVHRHVVAREVKRGVLEDARVASREDEPVETRPVGRRRIVAHLLGVEKVGDGGERHRGARMARVRLLDCVHREDADRVDRETDRVGLGHAANTTRPAPR